MYWFKNKALKRTLSALCVETQIVWRDPPHRKRCLESWVPIYRFLHCEVVHLVREKDSANVVERARRQVTDEIVVVDLDIRCGDAPPDVRVLRVVCPKNGL